MNSADFRSLALALPEAAEGGCEDHPDFRVAGRVFATLCQPDDAWAVVKLTPAQQAAAIATHPECFRPVTGAWGRRGHTRVHLPDAVRSAVCDVLRTAWANRAPRSARAAIGAIRRWHASAEDAASERAGRR